MPLLFNQQEGSPHLAGFLETLLGIDTLKTNYFVFNGTWLALTERQGHDIAACVTCCHLWSYILVNASAIALRGTKTIMKK